MAPVRLLLLVTFPLYVADQITKWATLTFIPLHHEIPIIPGLFNLVHVTNTGSAFGLMRGWFNFHVIFGTIMAGVMFWMLFSKATDRLSRLAAALILSGIFGNITDRLLHGHVIDFLDFHFGSYVYPTFNVADSGICIGVILYIWHSLRHPE